MCPCGNVLVGNGGKTYQSNRLNILAMTREITEGNDFQEL